jgi:hypothetical protein
VRSSSSSSEEDVEPFEPSIIDTWHLDQTNRIAMLDCSMIPSGTERETLARQHVQPLHRYLLACAPPYEAAAGACTGALLRRGIGPAVCRTHNQSGAAGSSTASLPNTGHPSRGAPQQR